MQGCFEYLSSKGNAPAPAGLQVMVDGIVPLGEPSSSPQPSGTQTLQCICLLDASV